MATPREALWGGWLLALAALAVLAVLPFLVGPTEAVWSNERALVFTFVLTIFALVCAVGSLALRETLVRSVSSGALDPSSNEGGTAVGRTMRRIWLLCLLVAVLGGIGAWFSASPARTVPFVLGALALLGFHAPRKSTFERA
jgi:hypothetical protein